MMTKITPTVLIAAAALICAAPLTAQAQPPAPKQGTQQRASPHETIFGYVAGDRRTGSLVTITYGRPYSARGGQGDVRKIWGGLVPWERANRLGADEATSIMLQHPIVVGATTIPAGVYTLYIVPSENGVSKLAFSTALGKWGIPVDETKDVARVDLTKEPMAEQIDQLTLAIENAPPDGGVLRIRWEKTQFSLAFKVKK
jgi:hypothetical protein